MGSESWNWYCSVCDDYVSNFVSAENHYKHHHDPPPSTVDMVNHPPHYTEHPSGIECIQITEHMNFCIGNAVKYLWRADLKNGIEDLQKAIWYINQEIGRRERL